jgi:PTS system mannose-specific IID component
MTEASSPASPRLAPYLRLQMLARLLLVQSSWNYESMLGTGLGFAVEPALRLLPGGPDGSRYREALARQSRYFNAHPYLAAIAAGALARAELDGETHERITRFRTALSGPLGSLGDQLVWAGLLPVCSLVALTLYGLGAGPVMVVVTFLLLYNTGHLFLRIWGLDAGWRYGLAVSQALGSPVLRRGPAYISRVGAALSGVAVPLVLHRLTGSGLPTTVVGLAGAVGLAFLLVHFRSRVQGWRAALIILLAYALLAVVI